MPINKLKQVIVPPPMAAGVEERSIFRLTSDSLPQWLPVPSFAFEVVRRSGGGGGGNTNQPGMPVNQVPFIVPPPAIRDMINQVVKQNGTNKGEWGLSCTIMCVYIILIVLLCIS